MELHPSAGQQGISKKDVLLAVMRLKSILGFGTWPSMPIAFIPLSHEMRCDGIYNLLLC
jgi:hypothetical protein